MATWGSPSRWTSPTTWGERVPTTLAGRAAVRGAGWAQALARVVRPRKRPKGKGRK